MVKYNKQASPFNNTCTARKPFLQDLHCMEALLQDLHCTAALLQYLHCMGALLQDLHKFLLQWHSSSQEPVYVCKNNLFPMPNLRSCKICVAHRLQLGCPRGSLSSR